MKSRVRFGSILAALFAALCLVAATAAADADATEVDPDSEPQRRSKGFWSMDREDLHDWSFELAGGGMYLDLEGKIGFETNIGDVSFGVNRLDLDNQWDGWITAEVKFLKKHHLRFEFLPVDFQGDTFVEGFPLDDPIFFIDTRIESRAKLFTYKLTYMYDFNIGKYLRLSPGVTLGVVDAKIRITGEMMGNGFEENQPVPVPEIGLRVEIFPLARLTIFGEAKGFTIGSKASVWDAGGGLRFHVNRNIYLSAAYRAIAYDIDWFDTIIDTRFHGPYIGAGLRF